MQNEFTGVKSGNTFKRCGKLRRIFLGIVFLFIWSVFSGASSAQVTLTSVHDTYIDSAQPTSNFGTRTSLLVSRSTVTQGQTTTTNNQYSFVEFNRPLSSYISSQDIVRATLRLYVNKVNVSAPSGVFAFGMCHPFNETTVTWAQITSYCTSFASYSQPILRGGEYVTMDVTGSFVSMFDDPTFPTITFAIFPNSNLNVAFDSKESGGNPPVLEIELKRVRAVIGSSGLTTNNAGSLVILGIGEEAITTQMLGPGIVTASKIASGSVGSAHLANGAVAANNIVAGAVNNLQLADNSVTSNKISPGAIATNQLSNDSVTESKLADSSVINTKIANGAVTEAKLADNSVTSTKIASHAVGNGQLGAGAVTSDKIASGQVVRSLNGLTDNINLIAGDNVTITPSGNSLTISSAGSQTAQAPSYNPQQIALKKWYSANQSGAGVAVGGSPYGIAFDGSNIWVSNAGTDRVAKIRASDGTILTTYQVGSNPRLVEFDGSNIWVANFGSSTVSKINASDGTTQTISVGANPWGLAFDGTNIWVACYGSNKVYKVHAKSGEVLLTVDATGPLGLAFDGTNIWAANNSFAGSVTKISGITGTPTTTIYNTNGVFPGNIAFDGTHIWVINSGNNSMTKFLASSGANLGVFGLPSGVGGGVAFDGAHLWVAGETRLVKFRVSDNLLIGNFPVLNIGEGIAFDGANIWVANYNGGIVTKHYKRVTGSNQK